MTCGRDALTGLPDAGSFTRRLDQDFARARREQSPISVMAVGLGRHGRSAGDRRLVASARALVRACRDGDYVAHAGRDEMVALLGDLHFTGCLAVAERAWREVGPGASVGVASYPARDIEKPKDLLRYAQAALARAKAEGQGQICLYQHQGYLFQPA